MKYFIISFIAFLLLWNLSSCTKEKTIVIACISLDTDTVDVGTVVEFKNCSSLADDYIWYFGSGKDSSLLAEPTYTYTTEGRYGVTLKAFRGEGKDSTHTYIVVKDPAVE